MRRRLLIIAPVLVVAAVVATVLLRGSAPEAIDLTAPAVLPSTADTQASGGSDDATDGSDGTEDAGPDAPAAAELTDASGRWVVRTDLVAFDGEAGDGTWVGYRIDEELATVGAFTAVGRTPDVTGEVVVAGQEVVEARIEAELATLRSDSGARDGQVRRLLGDREAVFELDGPLAFDGVPAEGTALRVDAPGRLRIGAVERPVVMALSATVDGDVLVLRGATEIDLVEFDVEPPRAAIVLSVAETGTVELQLLLTRD